MIPHRLWQPRQTLRGRLVFWYLTSIGLVVGLMAVLVTGLFWLTLRQQIDHHIHIAVTEAKQIVAGTQGEEQASLLTNLVSAQGMTVVVLSPDGAPIVETNSPDISAVTEHQLQRILASVKLTDTSPVHFTQGTIRFAAMPVPVAAGKGIVAVGYSTKVMTDAFYQLLVIFGVILGIVVVPTTWFGYVWLTRQLNPLERISTEARSIREMADLSKRVAVVKTTQELANIGEAFNSMLETLEHLFVGEHTFFADAAHTLKTPLAVLRSQVETIRIPVSKREELTNLIDSINETIQDLLWLTRLKSTPLPTARVNVATIMEDLAELARVWGEGRDIRVKTQIQPKVMIAGDGVRLKRALSALVHNAMVYNKPGGEVRLEVKQTGKAVVIMIADTGKGITISDQKNVFNRFVRGKGERVPGTGLGLSIAKATIEAYGGTLELWSRVGKGTKVTIRFRR